jgi:hypothetical protein
MTLNNFIKENRKELVEIIKAKGCPVSMIDNNEIALWVNNDEQLYLWAKSEKVNI